MMTLNQRARQSSNYREKGRYAKVNPCYVCGKSAGIDYYSHHDTDGLINDELLCLCKKCYNKLEKYDGLTAIKIAFQNKSNSESSGDAVLEDSTSPKKG